MKFRKHPPRQRSRKRLRPLRERFFAKVDKASGYGPKGDCHRWTAHLNSNGYGGHVSLGHMEDGEERPHRIAFYFRHGRWPEAELDVAHTCDVRDCVNPEHLFEATRSENVLDAVVKNRWPTENPKVRGELHVNAKLNRDQVRAIRRSSENGRLVAQRFGVSHSLVKMIRRREAWRWLDV